MLRFRCAFFLSIPRTQTGLDNNRLTHRRLSGNRNESTFWQYETLSHSSLLILHNALFQTASYDLPVFVVFFLFSCLGFTFGSSFSYITSLVRGIHNTLPASPTITFHFSLCLTFSAFPIRQG